MFSPCQRHKVPTYSIILYNTLFCRFLQEKAIKGFPWRKKYLFSTTFALSLDTGREGEYIFAWCKADFAVFIIGGIP
jgi:hypothetical protein